LPPAAPDRKIHAEAARVPFELLDHTADAGLRVTAKDLDALFADAAAGLTAVLVDDRDAIREVESAAVQVSAPRVDDLLHDWLAEVLFLFQTRRLIGRRFGAAVDSVRGAASGTVFGERYDEARHGAGLDVKAVTYHGLKVERVAEGYSAEVILDV
jgi:SHS2 domain-containing protein